MRNLLIVAALAAMLAPALVISTPAEAHRVCNEWGECWWHPDRSPRWAPRFRFGFGDGDWGHDRREWGGHRWGHGDGHGYHGWEH